MTIDLSSGKIKLPLLGTRGIVAIPHNELRLEVGRDFSLVALEKAMNDYQGYIFVTSQKDPVIEDISLQNLYARGTIARIKMNVDATGGAKRVTIQALSRAEVETLEFINGCYYVEVKPLKVTYAQDSKEMALIRQVVSTVERYIEEMHKIPPFLENLAIHQYTADELADIVAFHLNISLNKRQRYVETIDVNDRLMYVIEDMNSEIEISKIENEIEAQVKQSIEESQKEYYLREKMRVIKEELGDKQSKDSELDVYREKIGALENKAPKHIIDKLKAELDRLEMMQSSSPEAGIIRTYMDWIFEMPWGEFRNNDYDLVGAKKTLDAHHYGLEKVKERILEFLAVKKLTNTNKGAILCLVGPPGVGKTSLVKSISESIGREYVKIALGGIRDESEIRGHRRTYLGAMPGKIIQSFKNIETMNPVMLLDEIDKLASDFRGDPTSALLELLDPEQNTQFNDHYMEENIDLSNVLFIATANYMEGIPEPLYDRMEIIEIPSYTEQEKVEIAAKHLVKKQLKANGLSAKRAKISKAALKNIVQFYTREAGVRSLERQIATIFRKIAYNIVIGETVEAAIQPKNIELYLGQPRFHHGQKNKKDEVGIVTGLAYTQFGGDILQIEATMYPGKEAVVLTGQLGDVMRESVQTALSYVKSQVSILGIDPQIFETNTIHVHVPAGAVPKDGPSAGITMATAITSLLTNTPVHHNVGMTGEITLRGNVLPIGGLREKLVSAHRSNLKKIIIPYENVKDIEDVPEVVREALEIIPVTHVSEVLEIALKNK